jgi:alpha-glucosidase (family GH31 glycosyl hydrolase)
MSKSHILFLAICSFFVQSCSEPSKDDSLNEVISTTKVLINSQDFTLPESFVLKEYYTGNVVAEKDDSTQNQMLVDTINFKKKGYYYVKALAATSNFKEGQFRQLTITIKKLNPNQQSSEQEVSLMIEQQRATKWHHSKEKFIQVPDSGLYEVSIMVLPEKGSRLFLDQLLFVDRADYQPQGYEYLESNEKRMLPPSWAFGVIYGSYQNQENSTRIVNRLIEDNYTIDGFWTDSWFWNHYDKGDGPDGYLNFIGDTTAFPDMEQMWVNMEKNNIKSGIWVWDAIQDTGNEAVFKEFLEKGYFREAPEENTDGWHNRSKNARIGNIDFSNSDAVNVWKEKMTPFFKKGLDFLKLDRSSELDYVKANYELTQEYGPVKNARGFVMSHLHTTYDPRAKLYPIKWSGDAMIAWNQVDYPNMGNYSMGGLKQNIQMVADPNKTTYENIFLSNDIGGYSYFGSEEFSDELYMRWSQFGLLAPISTVFSTADNASGNLPFNFSTEAQENFRFYAKLKQALFPFIYTYAHQAIITGEKIRRGDGKHDTQYLLGKEFLVAPIYEHGARERIVYFPEGEWINFYDETELYESGELKVNAPLNQMPFFIRKGSIFPMRRTNINIASGSNNLLEWHLYPAVKGEFTLLEDDGLSTDYSKDRLAKTNVQYSFTNKNMLEITVHPVEGSFNDMVSERVNQFLIHYDRTPSSIKLNGNEIAHEIININSASIIFVDLPSSEKSEKQIIKLKF